MSIWLPGFERITGQRSGSLPRLDGPPKAVLHTDEVGRNTRALAMRHEWPPQLWVNPFTRERFQLIDLERTGYALKASQSVETNHMGRVVQVEVAGFAKDTHLWGDEVYRWLADEVVRPIHDHAGVPLVAYLETGFPSERSYGKLAPSRMSIPKWKVYTGFCTHQNVPDNEHWDAGQLPLGRIIDFAAPQEDDDVAVTNVIGQDHAKRWWWFKSTTSTGVEIDQDTADFWYMVDKHMYTGDPGLIEHLKAANALVSLDGKVTRK